jgi:indolepyruvate decarboxylase
MRDVLQRISAQAPRFAAPSFRPPKPIAGTGHTSSRITYASLCAAVQEFLTAGDIVVADSGSAGAALPDLLLPHGVSYLGQNLWGSIGWAAPAAFGAAVADPSRRVILVQGNGGHQINATQLGFMGLRSVAPRICRSVLTGCNPRCYRG